MSSTWPRSTTPPIRGRSARRTIDHRPPAGAAEAAPTRTQAAGVASTATGPHPLGSTPEPRMDPSQNPNVFHATTIVSVRRNGHVVVAGDGQVTLGNTVMKSNARKVRRLGKDGQVLAGFAGAAADAFTLFELFESKLEKHGQLTRAAVELAKGWRTERRFGKLEALLAVAAKDTSLNVSGNGDGTEPAEGLAIGSGEGRGRG